jgi:hypothetical protein
MPAILATQEAEIRRISVQSHWRQIVRDTLSRKYPSQTKAAEWLEVKALSSSPSITKKKKEKKKKRKTLSQLNIGTSLFCYIAKSRSKENFT